MLVHSQQRHCQMVRAWLLLLACSLVQTSNAAVRSKALRGAASWSDQPGDQARDIPQLATRRLQQGGGNGRSVSFACTVRLWAERSYGGDPFIFNSRDWSTGQSSMCQEMILDDVDFINDNAQSVALTCYCTGARGSNCGDAVIDAVLLVLGDNDDTEHLLEQRPAVAPPGGWAKANMLLGGGNGDAQLVLGQTDNMQCKDTTCQWYWSDLSRAVIGVQNGDRTTADFSNRASAFKLCFGGGGGGGGGNSGNPQSPASPPPRQNSLSPPPRSPPPPQVQQRDNSPPPPANLRPPPKSPPPPRAPRPGRQAPPPRGRPPPKLPSNRPPAGVACASPASLMAAINSVRAAHGVPAAAWNQQLADQAAQWAGELASKQYCSLSSSGPSQRRYNAAVGELLYTWYTPQVSTPSCTDAVTSWYNGGAPFYRATSRPFTDNAGFMNVIRPFAQVVWRSTTAVGCGLGSGWSTDATRCYVVVCHFAPAAGPATDAAWAANVSPRQSPVGR